MGNIRFRRSFRIEFTTLRTGIRDSVELINSDDINLFLRCQNLLIESVYIRCKGKYLKPIYNKDGEINGAQELIEKDE